MRVRTRHRRLYRGRYRRGYGISYRTNLLTRYRKPPVRTNNTLSLIGAIIVLIGIIIVFKNTMIYSGAGFSRGISLGIPCTVAFVLLILGIVGIINKKIFIGFILVSIGVIGFFISIIMNFRMVFMPINLLKAIMLFGFITLGVSIIIRGIFSCRR